MALQVEQERVDKKHQPAHLQGLLNGGDEDVGDIVLPEVISVDAADKLYAKRSANVDGS